MNSVARQVELADLIERWPVPGPSSDKYARGVVGLMTGSDRYLGAGVLSAIGALFSGAGMIRHCGPHAVAIEAVRRHPSITIGEGQVQAWVIGCGWPAEAADSAARVVGCLQTGVPLVLDAGALPVVPELADRFVREQTLLTPHAGELAQLLGVARHQIEADPLAQARLAAERWQVTVLLKGARQVVVAPDGEALQVMGGPAWTAQAGSGDVLAGVCGTLLAAGLTPVWAGALAASLQALTATRHQGPWPPERLAEFFPEVLASVVASDEGC